MSALPYVVNPHVPHRPPLKDKPCPGCAGSGVVEVWNRYVAEGVNDTRQCEDCLGSGFYTVEVHTCARCGEREELEGERFCLPCAHREARLEDAERTWPKSDPMWLLGMAHAELVKLGSTSLLTQLLTEQLGEP